MAARDQAGRHLPEPITGSSSLPGNPDAPIIRDRPDLNIERDFDARVARCVLLGIAAPVLAAEYPQRAVRMIVPYPPGGAGDIVGRMLSAKLTEALGQQVVVDNRGGGGQVIATQLAANAPPDGHTLFLASATHSVNPALRKKPALRHAEGFRADHARRAVAARVRRASVARRVEHQGARSRGARRSPGASTTPRRGPAPAATCRSSC